MTASALARESLAPVFSTLFIVWSPGDLKERVPEVRRTLWELGAPVRIEFPPEGRFNLDLDVLAELLEWGLPTGKSFRIDTDGQRRAVVVTPEART